ncbi:MAG: YicC family protein [Acidobacteria bacterium]|nr:YicC family protein [Acidobacteriota bacterium]
MPIRSMTGFAQVKGQLNGLTFNLSLKSLNHRFLDLHFHLPPNTDALEMAMRRRVKETIARGHLDVNLAFDSAAAPSLVLNRQLVIAYVEAFRAAAVEAGIGAEPDLNTVLRLPGALDQGVEARGEELTSAVLPRLEQAVQELNRAREEEGKAMEHQLRQLMGELLAACAGVRRHREAVVKSYSSRVKQRIEEWLGSSTDPERILQEAALLADRSDVQEELVRLENHVRHFLDLLDRTAEVGKKLDFLLQEMNREANTLLSKTSGLAGEALEITEAGLAIKAHVEQAREQVQNIE